MNRRLLCQAADFLRYFSAPREASTSLPVGLGRSTLLIRVHFRLNSPLRARPAPQISRALSLAPLAFSVLGLGCAAETDASVDSDLKDTSHAVVRVRSFESAQGAVHADALAGFLAVPKGADAAEVARIAGLVDSFPEKGECDFGLRPGSMEALDAISNSALLAADSVLLVNRSGVHQLSPYAFPTVADLLRGVVYISPDRSGEALPSDARYTLEGHGVESGDSSVLDLTSSHDSPTAPAELYINGVALLALEDLATTNVLDVSWAPSKDERDTVVVFVERDGSELRCSFPDQEGFGSVPLSIDGNSDLGAPDSSALVSVHRVRTSTDPAAGGPMTVLMTFDFAVEAIVQFSERSSTETAESGPKEATSPPSE